MESDVKPKAVIFDIDGTLLDSVDLHAQAWIEAFEHFGYRIPFEKVRPQIGKGGDQLMPAFISQEELKKIGHDLEQYRGELFKRKYLPEVRPFPRVRDLLLKIKENGQRIALASSGKEDEVREYKRIAHIDDLVDTDTSADDADRSKPAPDIFEAAIRRLTPLTPAEMIVVGDTVYDIEAARKARLHTVGLLCGGSSADALHRGGCVAIYADCAALFMKYETSPLAH